MNAEETDKKEDKTKSEGMGPMGSGMFEMMGKCCNGEETFDECAAMMKGKMAAMKGMLCCGSDTGKTGARTEK